MPKKRRMKRYILLRRFNFLDYKFDITNKLDRVSKKLQDGIFGKTKNKS